MTLQRDPKICIIGPVVNNTATIREKSSVEIIQGNLQKEQSG
jgi:hypothetical protein